MRTAPCGQIGALPFGGALFVCSACLTVGQKTGRDGRHRARFVHCADGAGQGKYAILNREKLSCIAGQKRKGKFRMYFIKELLSWIQDTEKRASACTMATVLIVFLLPDIGLTLVFAMWLIHSIWAFFQNTDRTVRIIYAVLAIVLAIALAFRLFGGA